MTNSNNILSPSKSAIREINFMLYNYNKIDELISKRKSLLIDRINFSKLAWYKGLNQDSNTMEDIIAKFDEDKVIQRYEHWRTFIGSLFSIIKNFESPIYYKYLGLRYLRKLDEEDIIKELNIDKKIFKMIKKQFYFIIYRYALKDSLYEEVLESVPV